MYVSCNFLPQSYFLESFVACFVHHYWKQKINKRVVALQLIKNYLHVIWIEKQKSENKAKIKDPKHVEAARKG